METDYRIKLMPKAEETYRALRFNASKLPADPLAPRFYEYKTFARMLDRVNEILKSLIDSRDVHLDKPLLRSLGWIRTRSIDSTLVYFFRIEDQRQVGILHITDCDSPTNSYARFCNFMNSGGWTLLASLGVDLPSESIGSSEMVQ